MLNMNYFFILLAITLVTFSTACKEDDKTEAEDEQTNGSTDENSGGDADTDSDADSDTDGDADGDADTSCEEDEYYPNWGPTTAPLLTLPLEIEATYCAKEDCDPEATGKNCEYYRVELQTGELLDVTATFEDYPADLFVIVKDPREEIKVYSTEGNDEEVINEYVAISDGEHHIAVCGSNCPNIDYTLTASSRESDWEPFVDDEDGDCTNDVQWGDGSNDGDLTFFEPVSNWRFTTKLDGDGDGVIDELETEISLQDLYCQGYTSAVFLVSDYYCHVSDEYYPTFNDTEIPAAMAEYNAAQIMLITRNFSNASDFSATEAYEHASETYGIENGIFVSTPVDFFAPYAWPSIVVIDLSNGRPLTLRGRHDRTVVQAMKIAKKI